MKSKILYLPILLVLLAGNSIVFAQAELEEDAIREVILSGYVNGAFNGLDPDAMGETFHEEFSIFSTDGENLNRYPIATWRQNVSAQMNDPNFDPASNVWDHNFTSIDITGNSAFVKLDLFFEDNHIYTDYLSLLKFNDGWKIVAKIYFEHEPG